MNRNPIIPFVVIMVFGIVLMFGLSFKGLGDAKDIAEGKKDGGEKKTEQTAGSPEDIYKANCLSCHGDSFQGGVGPELKGIGSKKSVDEIKTIIKDGTPGGMPGALVPEDKLDEVSEWLSKL